MARPLRITFPGAFYHITSRGNEQKNIFKSNFDRDKFLEYFESAAFRYDAIIHGYCLMDNHYHVLLETPSGNLSQIMRHINGAYTTYFNVKRKRSGHLFQGRYKAILVDIDEYAKELSRYIHLNPVRANISDTPGDYDWSSYPYYIGKKKPPKWLYRDFILGYFGKNTTSAQKGYKSFVERLLKDTYESPLAKVVSSTILGGSDFIEYIKKHYLSGAKTDKDIPALKELSKKVSLEEIFTEVETNFTNEQGIERNLKIYLSQKYSGKNLQEIAKHFGIGASGISQASRRFSEILRKDRRLMKQVEKIEKKLNLSIMKT